MKPFKINRDSWHYRLNMKFSNEYGNSSWGRDVWENRHRDFCSYWRATSFRVLAVTLLASVAALVLYGLGHAIYHDPVGAGLFFALLVGAMVAIFGTIFLVMYVVERHKDRLANQQDDKPEGLIAQRYRAYKSRICPMIEYDK